MEDRKLKICMIAPVPPPYGGIGNWVNMLDQYATKSDNIEFLHINTAPRQHSLDGRSWWDSAVGQGLVMMKLNRQF